MSDFKDRMIEAYERGECSYEGSYDYVRESMADAADRARKAEKENAADSGDQNFGSEKMVIYGDGSGTLRHLADYGTAISDCGIPIAPGSRAYGIDEREVTCPTCLDSNPNPVV